MHDGVPLVFMFGDTQDCHLSMVCEFYANLQPEGKTQILIVLGVEVNITLVAIHAILGTMDTPLGPFIELQIHPPSQAI